MPPPEQLTAAVIHHSFGSLQAEQGELLARQGDVSLIDLRPLNRSNQQDLELSGEVSDAKTKPYSVQIYYQPDEDWILSGDCTCPAGGDCRHCAALAFAWLSAQPQPVATETELSAWLEALKGPIQPEARPANEQIIYLLNVSEQEQDLQVSLQAALQLEDVKRRSKRPLPLVASELMQHPAAEENDRELGQLLRSLRPGIFNSKRENPAVPLSGSLGELALQQALATGRTFALDGRGQRRKFALQTGELRSISLNWEQVPGGSRLSTSLDPPAEKIFALNNQTFYLDSNQNELGPVDLAADKLQLLQRAPVIPEAALERVSRTLLTLMPAPVPQGVSLSEQKIAGVMPVPVLTLLGSELADEANPDTAKSTRPEQLALLQFDYQGERLPASTVFEALTTRLQGDLVVRIERVSEAEAQARQQLLATGLLPLSDNQAHFGFAKEPASDIQADTSYDPYVLNWHHWLHDSLHTLRAQGWQIEFEPSFKLAFLASPAWQAKLSADKDGKLFELSLGIEIGGEKVDLLPMIIRLLKTVPDARAMREQLEHHDIWLLPLDPPAMQLWAAKSRNQKLPQRWLEVPARRLAKVLDILIELYDYLPSDQEPGSLSLSAFNALQLKTQVRQHPNDYGVSWQAPPELETAAEQLAGKTQDGTQDIPVPKGLQAELRAYQQRGLNWLQTLRELGLDGILADDMGLGKTLQTLAHLLVEKQAGRLQPPALVVAPTSVLENWQREAERFAPSLKVILLHGPERDITEIQQAEVVITSYALFRRDHALHSKTRYSWLILDEAQVIKNPRSRTAKLLCAQASVRRLCLSGTPVENQLEELWSLFHFLMPGFLDTLERFNSRFRNPIEKTNDLRRQAALRERVRPLMLRRRKLEVEHELPPKIEILRTVAFGTAQRDLYETLRLSVDSRVTRLIKEQGFKRSRIAILDALLKLRQVCCHPHLLDLPEAQNLRRSAKLELLMELLPELVSEGRKVLIFSQFVKMLELMIPEIEAAGIPYGLLTGRTRKRQSVIDAFQNGEFPVFLISLKAGGLGLNLTTADTVIHYDPWWNPAAEHQATDRAWRIGQTKPVFVYKLIAAGTLEERILHLQQNKQALQQGLFEADPTATLQNEALLNLLKSESFEF